MNDMGGMGKLVPGFEFLQNLAKGAGAAMPHVGQWVAPTLDPAELDKRIEELRTVQFWLEQNVRMLATTIQALEVQRMTLSTLQTMNVSFGELTEALKVKLPESAAAPAAPAAAPAAPAATRAPRAAKATTETSKPATAGGAIDPMQWWGALTQQFTQIAAQALKDGIAEAGAPAPGGAAAAAPAPTAAPPAKKPARRAGKAVRKAPAKRTR